jgi:hypothetical protein
MAKKDHTNKKYGLLPTKATEYDTLSLGHCLCVSGGSIYNKDTSQKNSLLALTMMDPEIKHWLI